MIALVWAVIEAPSKGWDSPAVVGAFALAAVTLTAFIVWQRRAPEPLLDVRLFRNARFSAASATIMLLFFALFGFLFLSTQYLQFVLGYSPSAAGVRMLPYAGAMVVAAPMAARLAARFGVRRVVTAGMAVLRGRSARRGHRHHWQRLRPTGHRHARDGCRNGPGGHAGDGVDHELGAAGPRQRGIGGQRHHTRARRRAGAPEILGDPEPGDEEPFERPVDRFRKGAVGSVVAAGLLGIADALEARPPKEEIVIVSEVPSEPPRDPRRLELLLDPEHPERSLVFLPDPPGEPG